MRHTCDVCTSRCFFRRSERLCQRHQLLVAALKSSFLTENCRVEPCSLCRVGTPSGELPVAEERVAMISSQTERQNAFFQNLVAFSQQHDAVHWTGTFAEFLEKIVPRDPRGVARNSHQYVWDMLRWQGCEASPGDGPRYRLFANELFGIDSALERMADYFKAAAAGSEVGRRLLLLLG